MKKLFIFLAVIFSLFSFVGCGRDEKVISFYAPDGAPLISSYHFFESEEAIKGYTTQANLITGANVEPLIRAKTPDIIIAPIAVCVNSFDFTDKEYVFGGVGVFGLNHIVTNSDTNLQTLDGLIGETVYAFQKNGTPSQTLRALLIMYLIPFKEFTADDKVVDNSKVNIEYLPSPAAVRNAMTVGLEGKDASFYKFGLLAEPSVTAAEGTGQLKRAFDLQQLWQDKKGESYPQAGVLIRKSLVEADPNLADKIKSLFLKAETLSTDNAKEIARFVKDELNSSELPAKEIISTFLTSEVGRNAITFKHGADTNTELKNYLEAISVRSPSDEFFAI